MEDQKKAASPSAPEDTKWTLVREFAYRNIPGVSLAASFTTAIASRLDFLPFSAAHAGEMAILTGLLTSIFLFHGRSRYSQKTGITKHELMARHYDRRAAQEAFTPRKEALTGIAQAYRQLGEASNGFHDANSKLARGQGTLPNIPDTSFFDGRGSGGPS